MNCLKKPYLGRGIIAGLTLQGKGYVVYFLTGRSASSQARKLVYEEGIIRIEVTDKSELEKGNPALLVYDALIAVEKGIVASNGAQTKLVYNTFNEGMMAEDVLMNAFENPFFEGEIDITSFEPDPPNNTPRIALCFVENNAAMYSAYFDGSKSRKKFYPLELENGKGKLITTYSGGNENPLKPFTGEPLDVSIDSESAEEIAKSIYSVIGEFRVSVAVMMLDGEHFIINKGD